MSSKGQPLGSLEHVVLLAVLRLRGNAYGLSIRREIDAETGRALSIGAVHATLVRLELKGFVSSTTSEPTAARGGRARRNYWVTASGRQMLRSTRAMLDKLSAGLAELQAT